MVVLLLTQLGADKTWAKLSSVSGEVLAHMPKKKQTKKVIL
jgi:hypothetical protein